MMPLESALELDDIQSGVLCPRPTPYQATYVIFRIDDRKAGRELMRRLSRVVASAARPTSPAGNTCVSAALSFQGLEAFGVPRASLESFPLEFQQGMAARAKILGDNGESSPENWEKPLGSADVHVVVTALAPDAENLEAALKRARRTYQELPGVTAIWRQDCHVLPDETEVGADPRQNNAFLFKQDDSIGYKTPCGSHIRRMNPRDADVAGVVRIHRMIRRGTSYGPPLPNGVLDDDGIDRGLMFAFVGAQLGRQFEFVQSEWMNGASFFGGSQEKDPI